MKNLVLALIVIQVSCNIVCPREFLKLDIHVVGKDEAVLSRIENGIYGKNYKNNDVKERIERLEQSLYKKNYIGSTQSRIERIQGSFELGDKYLENKKKLVFFELMENRFIGRSYKNDDIESRILRLEVQFFGHKMDGNTEQRYINLIENAPDSIKDML